MHMYQFNHEMVSIETILALKAVWIDCIATQISENCTLREMIEWNHTRTQRRQSRCIWRQEARAGKLCHRSMLNYSMRNFKLLFARNTRELSRAEQNGINQHSIGQSALITVFIDAVWNMLLAQVKWTFYYLFVFLFLFALLYVINSLHGSLALFEIPCYMAQIQFESFKLM